MKKKKKRLSQRERYARMLEANADGFERSIKRALEKNIIGAELANLDTQWVKAYRAAARAIREGGF